MSREKIRELNDWLRTTFQGGRVLITQGVAALPPRTFARVLIAVRSFADFGRDNDPHGEHDFGSGAVDGHRIIWKIDYYDPTMTYGSEDPADPARTQWVLTIMLAEEY